jgi:sugar phosphate isomerase/epimerase
MRHLGVDAVEIALSEEFSVLKMDSKEKIILGTDDDAKAYGAHLAGLGVKPCAFLTAMDFSDGDMADKIAWEARAIELADLIGMPCVRIDSAMARERELDFEERVRLFAEGLGGALERTSGSKVTLGIENHGFQGNNLAFQLNVYNTVGSDRLGSTMDTGNFYWRGYPLSEVYGILRILAPYAKHTHLKNIKYPEDKREVTRECGWEYGTYVSPLDEGDIDHAKVLGILADAGYDGDICIEDESLHHFKTPEERIAVLERDVVHCKEIIASLG